MNLPNKLTVLRVILVPFFVVFLLLSKTTESMKWIALVLFIVASLTDLLDGHIARSRNLVTTFGKFMDPLADKILTISGMICLIELGRIPSWIVVIKRLQTDCHRAWYCHCRQLLGQMEDYLPDDHDHPYDH